MPTQAQFDAVYKKTVTTVKVHFLSGEIKEYPTGKIETEYFYQVCEREGIDHRTVAGYKFRGQPWIYIVNSIGLSTGYTGEYIKK